MVVGVLNPVPLKGYESNTKNNKVPLDPIAGEGDSIREALVNMSRSMEKRIFAGHNKVRLFTERFAREDILPVLEVSSRDRLMDETPLMILIKGKDPDEVFFSSIGLSDMVGDYFEDLAEQQERQTSKAVNITALDFIKDYFLEGKQPVMGLAEIVEGTEQPFEHSDSSGNDSQGNSGGTSQDDSDSGVKKEEEISKIIVYEGLAAFKDGNFVGYMNGIEARAYNIITKTVNASVMSLPLGDNQTVVKISNTKANIKTFLENDQVFVHVNVKVKLDIIEESGGLDVSMPEPLKTVEAQFNEIMKNELEAAIRKAQTEFESDIFGFGRQVHIQHPDRWPNFKENWDKYFSKASVEVVVESSVARSGQLKQPFTKED